MATALTQRATIDDLYKVEGKAKLIGGRIIYPMFIGRKPNRVSGRIHRRVDDHAEAVGVWETYTDNIGFVVPELPSGRQSFSPDVSYYVGPFSDDDMRFIEGTPTLAVEVRSENDYGSAAEREMAEKRADYFAAGTLVVWDVDPEAEEIHVYRSDDSMNATTYIRGQTAEAEPAVPGWSVEVDEIVERSRGK